MYCLLNHVKVSQISVDVADTPNLFSEMNLGIWVFYTEINQSGDSWILRHVVLMPHE
jgi:hypothetical protein